MRKVLVAILITVFLAGGGYLLVDMKDALEFTSPPPQQARERYDQAVRQAQAEHNKALLDANRQFNRELDAALTAAMEARDLQEANRITMVQGKVAARINNLVARGAAETQPQATTISPTSPASPVAAPTPPPAATAGGTAPANAP